MQLNSSKPLAGIAAMLFLFYLIYVLIASSPLSRLNRMCSPPFVWSGKVFSSAVALASPGTANRLSDRFQHGFYACRRWGWNVFYEQSYERMQRDQERAQQEAPVTQQPGGGARTPAVTVPRGGAR
jgi:hypothetical protein